MSPAATDRARRSPKHRRGRHRARLSPSTSRLTWRNTTVWQGLTHDRRDRQFESPGEHCALAFLLDVRGQRGCAGFDVRRVRGCDPRAVPGASRRRAMSNVNGEPTSVNGKSWTARARERAVGALPPEKLLPDSQPSYMSSWIYVFGVLTLTSLIVIIGSGSILALKGPGWWHFTGIGHFFNSIHLWSVELFFFFMVIHLWGKYWMAAWRGGRARVWMTGAVAFVVAVPCALTGYVSQQNFDAQWISTQAKDGLNAAGVGAFFNLLNFGQMYSYHVFLLPLAVVAIVAAHILLVRKHGIVPPFERFGDAGAPTSTSQPSPVPVPAPPSAPAAEDRSEPMAARDAPQGELAP